MPKTCERPQSHAPTIPEPCWCWCHAEIAQHLNKCTPCNGEGVIRPPIGTCDSCGGPTNEKGVGLDLDPRTLRYVADWLEEDAAKARRRTKVHLWTRAEELEAMAKEAEGG